jgi:hypothetical protein
MNKSQLLRHCVPHHAIHKKSDSLKGSKVDKKSTNYTYVLRLHQTSSEQPRIYVHILYTMYSTHIATFYYNKMPYTDIRILSSEYDTTPCDCHLQTFRMNLNIHDRKLFL